VNIQKLAALCATIFSIPLCHAAVSAYDASTAPDAASREVLSHPVRAFEEGAAGPNDIAAAIERNYPKIVEQNIAAMRPANAAAWMDQLSDLELQHLAQLYVNANATAGRSGKLLAVAASRFDGTHLSRLAHFFGYNEVYSAVASVSPQKMQDFMSRTQMAYSAPVPGAALSVPMTVSAFRTGGVSTMAGFTPSTSMTLEQLYSGFRTMGVGSMAGTAAIYETAMYAGRNLVVAWGAGYAFGSGITYMMQEYTPDFYYNTFVPAVGGTIANTITYVQNTVTTVYNDYFNGAATALGNFQMGTIPVYGNSPTVESDMGATGGDFGMEYEFMEVSGGGGGGSPCGRGSSNCKIEQY
jgi:hypothetical protein